MRGEREELEEATEEVETEEEERVGEKENVVDSSEAEEEREGGERIEGEGGRTETGILKEKVEPFPIIDLTSIFPPIVSTSDLQIASPNPVPAHFRVTSS